MPKQIFNLGLLTSLLLICAAEAAQASSGLGFSPQRIIMGPRDRTAVLTLTNRGKTTTSYRVGMVDVIYQKDGRVRHVNRAPAGFPSAKSFIRFSPRQVRLRPGQTQTVRILLRNGHRLQDGEYRVHAVLRALPDVSKIQNPVRRGIVRAGVGISQGVALPIIVRRGRTQATGKIQSVRIKRGRLPKLDVQLVRSGNQSLYTDLRLRNRRGKVLKQIKGIAVPVPNRTRRYLFPIAGLPLRGGYVLDMVDHETGKVYSSVKFR